MFSQQTVDIEALVGKNSRYYLEKFEYMRQKNKATWNWAAFFFGTAWLIYRKMYMQASIYFVISCIIGWLMPINYISGMIMLPLALGLWGNYLYMMHVTKQSSGYSGGGNLLGVIVFCVLMLVVLLFTAVQGVLLAI
ncbi:MAG: DUF2628 domain-containing protein [Endomicrobium sp.]|jgi:hypothetical protein|nr:DUF2628 domain-containing protein [Endomicrobium sp.]